MSTIATLNVSVTANTYQFAKGMKTASHAVNEFTIAAGALIAKSVEIGAALAARTVEGLAQYVKSAFESIEATTKLSDRLQIGTDQLVAFQYAATSTGSSVESMNSALGRMSRFIGDAATGNKKANATLEMLGLTFAQIKELDTGEAFATIADRISAIGSASTRAALEAKIFGKTAGPDLDRLLAGGVASINKAIEKTNELGIAFDRVDGAKIQIAAESFKDLKAMVGAAANSLAVELAPFLDDITKRVIAFANANGGMKAMVVNAFQGIIDIIAEMADYWELAKAGFYAFEAGVLTGIQQLIVGSMMDFNRAINTIINTFEDLYNVVVDKTNKINEYIGTGIHFDKLTAKSHRADVFTDMFKDLEKAAADAAEKAAVSLGKFANGENANAVTEYVNKTIKDFEKLAVTIADAATKRNDLFGGPEADEKKKKNRDYQAGSFQEIDITRVSIAGLAAAGKKQETSDARTHDLLEKIAENTEPGMHDNGDDEPGTWGE